MAILILIILGALLGWLASILARTEDASGIFKNIGLGLVASVVGGLLMNGGAVLGAVGWLGLGVAALAAVLVLAAYNLVFVARF
ncbi:MAG: hypothetical protein AAGE86_09780 [Pseudomonadota bacterium]